MHCTIVNDLIPEDKVAVGRITKAHGTAGEMVVYCFSGQPENVQHYRELVLLSKNKQISVPLTVRTCRLQGKKVLLSFEGIGHRSQLDELIGALVLAAKNTLPKLSENQFYWCDYIGKSVKTDTGRELGTVKTIFCNGAQDVLVVEWQQQQILIPVTPETIVSDSCILVVKVPPGLIEINSKKPLTH